MKNIILIYRFVIFVFIIIILKLVYLNYFSPYLNSKNQHFQSNLISPVRGNIYDRNLEPLALSYKKFQLILDKKNLKSKDEVRNFLEANFQYEASSLEAKLAHKSKWLNLGISIDQEKKSQLKLPAGITLESEHYRYYPDASLSSHLLGFVGKNADNLDQGYFGLEGYYNEELKGLPGIIQSEQNLKGLPIIAGTRNVIFGENGHDLITSIDKNIQYFSKNRLLEGMNEYGAESACIIVADPNDGKIIALTCLPDFDPNFYWKFASESFKNPTISNLFEPGSIFKPVIMAQAFQSKILNKNSTFEENGPVNVSGALIKTWDEKYEGKITMQRVIEKSSNVGMVYVGQQLGKENLYSFLDKIGVFSNTNIDLQGEVHKRQKEINQYYELDFASFTFGQGISMTPLQALQAFIPLVNGGYFVQPHVLLYSRTSSQKKVEKTQPKKFRIFDETVSKDLKSILYATVNGAEAKYQIPNISSFGGKSGTAQIALEGKYDQTSTVASFIGFFPIDDPKYIVLTTYFRPKSSIYGSETAAPTFFKLSQDILNYQN